MLIFRKDDIKVYACPLALPGEAAGGSMRAAEERKGVARLLNEAFGEEDVRLDHTPEGAPFLPGRRESVSVSHCRGWAVLAVSADGRRIGVDAESVGREKQLRRVASRFLSRQQSLAWSASESLLLRAWTIKEALYKAAGIAGWALTEIPLPDVPLPIMDGEVPEPYGLHQSGVADEAAVCVGDAAFTLRCVDCGDAAVRITLATER